MARLRSRYASDDQVRRIARLAAELGISASALRVGGDGSVLIIGASSTAADRVAADEPDEVLEAWEAEHHFARLR